MVGKLLKDGKTSVLKGFKSKKGKDFSAALRLDEEGKIRFEFKPRENSRSSASSPPEPPPPPSSPVGLGCRCCAEGRVIAGRSAWGCDQWRQGCGLRIPFALGERSISPAEAVALLQRGECGELKLDAGIAVLG